MNEDALIREAELAKKDEPLVINESDIDSR